MSDMQYVEFIEAKAPWFKIVAEVGPSKPRVADIIRIGCQYLGCSRDDLLSDQKGNAIVYARWVMMAVTKSITSRSLPAIGRSFNRHHSTVIHGLCKMAQLIREDWTAAYDVAHVEAAVLAHLAAAREKISA